MLIILHNMKDKSSASIFNNIKLSLKYDPWLQNLHSFILKIVTEQYIRSLEDTRQNILI